MTVGSCEFESHLLHQRKECGNSSVGRAQPCQGWGREFEPRFPLKGNCPGGGMVDALVSGASVERRAGSSPVLGTKGRLQMTLFNYGEVAELVDALL